MGCFLGCFGGSKDRRRRKKRNKVIPRDQQLQKLAVPNPLQAAVSTEQGIRESRPKDLVSELRYKSEEQSSSSTRKRVTFNSNVTTFEHDSLPYESTESLPDCNKFIDKEKDKILSKSSDSQSTSGDDSVTSSDGSYPPNHRYQNCRDSDDEAEECGDSDLDDIDDNEECFTDCEDDGDVRFVNQEVWSESVLTASIESRTEKVSDRTIVTEEVESLMPVSILLDQEVKTVKLTGNVRDRSDYVHPVLNPVENLTQWKTVKSRGTPQFKSQKENFTAELEAPHISFSSEPTFKSEQYKIPNQEVAVDASLSTWLSSPGSTHIQASPSSHETVTSEKFSMSQGSTSVRSFADRPILGALTVEELKQLSATSSPRKSPSRSPDDMPIIGTVGTYWNAESVWAKDSRSAASYKGIPNTTSKYREDKRVNWHSTPFETRLERALNCAGEA